MEEECYSPEDEKLEPSDVWIRVKLTFFTHRIVKFLHNRRHPKLAPRWDTSETYNSGQIYTNGHAPYADAAITTATTTTTTTTTTTKLLVIIIKVRCET